MKTNKHQTLRLAHTQQGIQARDLVQHYGYSPATARSYLCYLHRQDLFKRIGRSYTLSPRGEERLRYFDVAGCGHAECLLCQKQVGHFTCPRCAYEMATTEARILPEQDFLFVVRHAGVYCPRCLKLFFPEAQAVQLGIPKEQ